MHQKENAIFPMDLGVGLFRKISSCSFLEMGKLLSFYGLSVTTSRCLELVFLNDYVYIV